MLIEHTQQGKVRLYNAETGEAIERWPVDAKGMVASGEYSYEKPTGRSKAAKTADAGTLEEGETTEAGGPVFDPVTTPSMDPIMGHPSGEVDMQLGAATSVSVGVEPEGVAGAVEQASKEAPADTGGVRASAVRPATGSELPEKTPLGERAVYGRADTARSVGSGQAPVRTKAPGKGGR